MDEQVASIRPTTEIAVSLAGLLTSSEFTQNVPWEEEENYHIAEWLYLSASIQNVSLNRASLLPDFGFCRGADNHELTRDHALARCVTDLSRFLFTWGSLESAILAIDDLSDSKVQGKIRKARHFIDESFGDNPLLCFEDELVALQKATEAWIMIRPNKEAHRDKLGRAAMGLRLVYVWRNHLAHGSLHLPGTADAEITLRAIASCRTLTLLSIQMLLFAAVRRHDFRMSCGDYEDQYVTEILSTLHLVEPY